MEQLQAEQRHSWQWFKDALLNRLGLVGVEMGPTTDMTVEPEGIEFYTVGPIKLAEGRSQEEVQ